MKNILLIAVVFILHSAISAGQPGEEKKTLPKWNIPIGQTEVNLVRSSKGESTMNNLIGDIMLWQTNTDFAFINYGDIHADFEAGPITDVDLYKLIPFDRTLVIIEVTGEFLQKLVEYNISGLRQGMAIAGAKVECDMARPDLHRLNYFQVGEYPCYPQKDYRIVTTDYLADGNAGFGMLTGLEPVKVFRTGILLRDAVREYIKLNSPLTTEKIKLDGRWERRLAPADE
jgi:5'-nucleotidase/UDP-sugar diphosphatase